MLSRFGRSFGRGPGSGGGMGFGFRGSSPPWPYIGRGRGGLPRCGYFLSNAAGSIPAWQYQPLTYPFFTPPAPQVTPEQEGDFLRSQAQAMRAQLNEIEARISELSTEKK